MTSDSTPIRIVRPADPFVVVASILLFLTGCATVPRPTAQIAVAKTAIANAVTDGGSEYATEDMKNAQDRLDHAMQAMAMEDYVAAKRLAEEAQVDAQLAATKARAEKAQKAADAVHETNDALRKEIDRENQ